MDKYVKREMRRVIFNELGLTGGQVLDIGSYDVNGTFRELFDDNWEYIGIDRVPGPNVDVVVKEPGYNTCGCGSSDPSYSADLVISSSCLQYSVDPFSMVRKMSCWLKDGGYMVICAPRHEKDGLMGLPEELCVDGDTSFDCWRFLPKGMMYLLDNAGLANIRTWYHNSNCWGIGKT